MSYKKIVCPHCGGKLKIESDEYKFICPYCEETIELERDADVPEKPSAVKAQKKKKTKRKSMIALIVTFGVLLLLIVTAYIFRHQIINLFTEPEGHPSDGPAPWRETESTDDTKEVAPNDKDRVYNILICGQDKVSGLTDVNLLVNFNVSKLTMSIMQIPRDTNMDHDGYYYTRANGVFKSYGSEGWEAQNDYVRKAIEQYPEDEVELRGIAGYAALLEQNLCVKIHYYAVMDLSGFKNIVDALGGVDMYVPYDLIYNDPNQDLYINIPSGYQHLDGNAAEGVVRYREGYAMADIGRGNVQKVFMASLVKTIQDNANIFNAGKIVDVCNIVADNLVTNMTTSDMIYFANNAMTVDMQYVTFMTAPVGGFQDDNGVWYTCINKAMTLKYINDYFNIFDEPVTSDEFDSNNVFYMDTVWYYGPEGTVPEYIYRGSDMMDESFKPVVGY